MGGADTHSFTISSPAAWYWDMNPRFNSFEPLPKRLFWLSFLPCPFQITVYDNLLTFFDNFWCWYSVFRYLMNRTCTTHNQWVTIDKPSIWYRKANCHPLCREFGWGGGTWVCTSFTEPEYLHENGLEQDAVLVPIRVLCSHSLPLTWVSGFLRPAHAIRWSRRLIFQYRVNRPTSPHLTPLECCQKNRSKSTDDVADQPRLCLFWRNPILDEASRRRSLGICPDERKWSRHRA